MTLAVAGPVDHEHIRTLADGHFGSVEQRALTEPDRAEFAEDRSAGEARDVQQAAIHLVMPGPGIDSGERELMATQLVTMLLGGSMSSRLFISVRERQGLCYHISASLHPYVDAGVITIATGVDPERAEQAVEAVTRELERLLADGVTDDEVAKARAMYKGRYSISREDSMSLAIGGAIDLLNWKRIRTPEEVFALVDSLSAEDLLAAARRWHRPERLRVAVVGPGSVSADRLAGVLQNA